jgi:cytochrome c553
MTAQVASLSEIDMRNVAAYFSSRNVAVSVSTAPVDTAGERLFKEGKSITGIPACQGCHGVAALGGEGPLQRSYPRLRSQQAAFLEQRLKDYRAGKLAVSTNDEIMIGVARSLDDDSIAHVVAWLGALGDSSAK